jgi:Flp pilus assembly protein TadB
LPARLAILLPLLGAVYVGLVLGAAALLGEDPDWLRPLPPLVGSFTAAFLAARWQRRRMGGAERVQQFRTALRSGRLPEDADPVVWRPLLAREQRSVGKARNLVLGILGLFVVAWGLVALVGSFTWPAAVVSVGLVLAVVVLVWVVSRRTVGRIDRLVAQMPGHQPRERHSAR